MESYVLSVRAVGSEFAKKLWLQNLPLAVALVVIPVILLVWLTSYSVWWWLLAFPFSILVFVTIVITIIFWLLIRYVRPTQSKTQKAAVTAFVDKLQFAKDITDTPKIVILFRVVRSIASPSSNTYVHDIANIKGLKNEFQAVTQLFKK